jgi:Na+/citrate or Na+/malate symporter
VLVEPIARGEHDERRRLVVRFVFRLVVRLLLGLVFGLLLGLVFGLLLGLVVRRGLRFVCVLRSRGRQWAR